MERTERVEESEEIRDKKKKRVELERGERGERGERRERREQVCFIRKELGVDARPIQGQFAHRHATCAAWPFGSNSRYLSSHGWSIGIRDVCMMPIARSILHGTYLWQVIWDAPQHGPF